MKRSMTFAAAILAGAAVLSGCASTSQQPQQIGYISNDSSTYGTIDAIQVMQGRQSSGVGAVTGGLIGGLLGNQVGSGGGRAAATVAGAVGGAVVGNNVENNRNAKEEYQISVRMDNGETRVVQQDSVYDLRVGNRVRLIDGRLYRYSSR
ncbi:MULTISPECIES: glycine zipper 2TM domain-containing protein [unclassified Duganella]|jgi:outer membrane lipoprotein SlyB|uniref:glycine zipper 2TM domain-containing protein n=1 Tax=unclassified Duganella TaxID=2636909 RepID=UPI00088F51E0|nr:MULTISPECIES: glycine zipper 2TM domain-containing protein [unclassified Duganella]SDH55326.1 Outer membrane lipoprotein SlyB [Duganella sp. OV458]SDK67812.1 Outer membrane lipoprotein SlyB [Duganella sp. OV510]